MMDLWNIINDDDDDIKPRSHSTVRTIRPTSLSAPHAQYAAMIRALVSPELFRTDAKFVELACLT